MSADIKIAEFARGDDRLLVQLREYNDRRFVDLRMYVDDNGTLVPTKRGVTIRLTEIDQIVAALDRAQIIAKGSTP